MLTVMLAMRFMMSVFPAAERRKDEPPWAALVSLTDPLLRPFRKFLQLVRLEDSFADTRSRPLH